MAKHTLKILRCEHPHTFTKEVLSGKLHFLYS